VYPRTARENLIQGTVVLKAIINTKGDVVELSVIPGDPELTQSAIEAVKQWKYKPFLLDGQPAEVETTVQINFTLSRG
jgi:TonB family protein